MLQDMLKLWSQTTSILSEGQARKSQNSHETTRQVWRIIKPSRKEDDLFMMKDETLEFMKKLYEYEDN